VILIGAFINSKAQQDVLTRISSSIEMEPFSTGYVNSAGDTIIPIGKYVYCETKEFDKIAIVVPKGYSNYYAIDRTEKVLFEVLSIDNGPDYVKDGLFRIRKNGKVGYANLGGKIIVKPIYSAAMPFSNGYAAVCIGGKTVSEDEHTITIGGKWGNFDTLGNVIVSPQYDRAWGVKEGKALIEKNNKRYTIDVQ
jgi:hypothetical protein